MKALYDLRNMLCEEIEEYGRKGEVTSGMLDVVDKLTHTVKNLDKIIEKYEDEESYSMNDSYKGPYNGSYNGGSYNGRYDNRSSYRRRRDSMGRYSNRSSYDDGMIEELRQLMQDAPDDRTRKEFQTFISKMEQM